MEFLFKVAVTIAVCLLWDLLVIFGLGLFGIHIPMRFLKRQGIEKDIAIVRLGKRGYVFVKGVLLFGCGLFAGITTSDYVSQRYLGDAGDRLTLASTALGLVIFAVCGVFFGLYDWNRSAQARMR
jgi:hypothetical protein